MNEQLKETIAHTLNVDPAELTTDKQLADFDDWDSVTVLTLMFVLGKELGTEIMPDEVTDLRTFGDIEKLVASKQN